MKIVTWVKGNALAVVSALLAIAMSVLYWQRKRAEIGSLKDAVTVERSLNKIAAHETKKEILKASADDTAHQEAELDIKIADAKKTVVEVRLKAKELPDDKVLAEFDRLYGSSRR